MINHHWMFGILFVDKPLTKTMVSDLFIVNEPHFVSSDYMWRNTKLEKHSYFNQRTYSFLNHWVQQWYMVYNQTQLDGFISIFKRSGLICIFHWTWNLITRHFHHEIFLSSYLLLNNNYCILFQIRWPLHRRIRLTNDSALVQIMTWHRSGNKPFSKPIIV